jgi:transcriptional regulator with XRE-family HTH domain
MDWQKIISDLQEAGLTQQQIAKECMTGQSHISSLARGKRLEPRHSLGERLLQLHRDRTHIRRKEAA